MLHEEPYEERTSDLIARIRKMREAAREQMDRFGDPAEYNVEILHGRKNAQVTPDGAKP